MFGDAGSRRALAFVCCIVVAVVADDSKSIDGGFHYDYGQDRHTAVYPTAFDTTEYANSVKPTVYESTLHTKYYTRKYKRRKPVIVDGLPLYRD